MESDEGHTSPAGGVVAMLLMKEVDWQLAQDHPRQASPGFSQAARLDFVSFAGWLLSGSALFDVLRKDQTIRSCQTIPFVHNLYGLCIPIRPPEGCLRPKATPRRSKLKT